MCETSDCGTGEGSASGRILESDSKMSTVVPELPINIPFRASDTLGSGKIKIKLMLNYCREDTGICFAKLLTLQIPVQITRNDRNQRGFVEYKVNP